MSEKFRAITGDKCTHLSFLVPILHDRAHFLLKLVMQIFKLGQISENLFAVSVWNQLRLLELWFIFFKNITQEFDVITLRIVEFVSNQFSRLSIFADF